MTQARPPWSLETLLGSLWDGSAEGEHLWVLSDVIRLWRTPPGSERPPWPDELAPTTITDQVIEELGPALVSYIEADWSGAAGAVWVLGKLGRDEDEPLFVRALTLGLEGDDGLLHQGLIALHDLGRLPQEVTALSAAEPEANRRIARAYLDSLAG